MSVCMCNLLLHGSPEMNAFTQEPMTCMSALNLVQAVRYCSDTMPACIQPISLEQGADLAEHCFQILAFVLHETRQSVKCYQSQTSWS